MAVRKQRFSFFISTTVNHPNAVHGAEGCRVSWIRRTSDLWREFRDMQTLLATPPPNRPIMVYSEDVSSYNMLEGYLSQLMESHQRSVHYVTSAPEDPLFSRHHDRMSVYYANRLAPTFIPKVDSKIFITTMPDLSRLHVGRPRKESCCLYIFHSLNSIHEVYRPGAFDHYDAFFCTGPHHTKELETHFALHRLPMPTLHEVGYYKLDRVYQAYQSYRKKHEDKKTILLAPSWGKGNLLESHGSEIVERLVDLETRIVVRPHPCFFLPIYPQGRSIVDGIVNRFENNPNVEIERSIDSEDSFHEADLMISDFSGAAFEYALGTGRPVLFIDVARKTMNPDWKELGLPTFEDTMRYRVGRVLAPKDIPSVQDVVSAMLEQQADYAQRLTELRDSAIYNFGRAAEVGARIIDEMLQ
jgi:YidC/Oxa1 family membrane protein insertase